MNDKRKNNKVQRLDRIGEIKYQTSVCLNACIVEYRGIRDIDVLLENGWIVKNTTCEAFDNGRVWLRGKETYLKIKLRETKKERVGTRKQMNSGLWAIVNEYRRSDDIDILFEKDGSVAKNKRWKDFLNGKIAHPSTAPSYDKDSRIGEVREMRNGLKAKIVAYRHSKDIDVEFVDDGVVVEHAKYYQFQSGCIGHPTKPTCYQTSLQEFSISYYLEPIGFRKIKKGEWKNIGFGNYELDFYHDQTKVAIEYDGAIHNKIGGIEGDVEKNRRCKELGIVIFRLRDPSLKELIDGNSINFVLERKKRIGKELIIDCQTELEAILNYCNIDFQEDYINFKRDLQDILTKYKRAYIDKSEHKRIGERSFHKLTNQWMTITAYYNCRNIDVKFDDGEIRTGVRYASFKAGTVLHPKLTRSDIAKMTMNETSLISKTKRHSAEQAIARIGERYLLKNGREIVITKYLNSEDVTVQYLDNNEIKANLAYWNIRNQSVKFLGKG